MHIKAKCKKKLKITTEIRSASTCLTHSMQGDTEKLRTTKATIRYDTIEEINVDSKAEYTA